MSNKVEFLFEDHKCLIVIPDNPRADRAFLWRTEFPFAFDMADCALIDRGFFLVYCSVSNEYGSPYSIEVFKRFHDFIVKEYDLSPRASLFGFSRGGLYACNYACAYPEDVACLYLDAPVLDLFSWPAGLGLGIGSPDEWEDCKRRVLDITEVPELRAYRGHPIARLHELIATKLPVILVAGGVDQTVPYSENGAIMAAAYEKAGAPITVIVKPDCDHHPHSLEDPTPIVDFVEAAHA